MGGPCKLGIAKNPHMRLIDLQVGHPHPLKVFHISERVDGPQEEARIHVYLAHKRLSGEWFQVTVAEAVEACREMYNQPPPTVIIPGYKAKLECVAPHSPEEAIVQLAEIRAMAAIQRRKNAAYMKQYRARQRVVEFLQ